MYIIYIYTVGTRSFRLIGNFLLERFPFIWAARRLNNVAAAATLVITHTRARDFSPRDPHRQFLALSPHGSATTSSVLPSLSLLPYPPLVLSPPCLHCHIYIYNSIIRLYSGVAVSVSCCICVGREVHIIIYIRCTIIQPADMSPLYIYIRRWRAANNVFVTASCARIQQQHVMIIYI